jgi:hypothetical protein
METKVNKMKKSILVINLIGMLFCNSLYAQDTIKVVTPPSSIPRVEFGFRFMPTFSSFDMKSTSGGTLKGEVTLGFGIGAMLGTNFTNHTGMQIELIYNSLSQKYQDQNIERKINVRYVNIPLLFTLNTGVKNPVNLRLVAGPQLGLNVGSSVSTAGSDTIITVLSTKRNDFGFAYGVGLAFALNTAKTLRFDMGYRGVYGLVNISNTSQTAANNSVYILNRALVRTNSAYLGITFLF